MLESNDTFATNLLAILIHTYGVEVIDWEPETLYVSIINDFGVNVPDFNRDKIGALTTALTTNQFYVSFNIFHNVCDALTNGGADFETFSPLSVEELSWGVVEVFANDPPEEGDGSRSFSHSVAQYVGVTLAEHGLYKSFPPLSFAEFPDYVKRSETVMADDALLFGAASSRQTTTQTEIMDYLKERYAQLKQQCQRLQGMLLKSAQ